MSEKTTDKVKTVKVKLLKAHTHAGMKYDAGFDLELSEQDAKWLKDLKIAKDLKASPSAPVKSSEEK